MARNSSSFKLFICLTCIGVCLQTEQATAQFSQPWANIPLPNPQKCVESFTSAGICLVDVFANFGKPPSEACCTALKNIDDTCWPILFYFINPNFTPLLKGLCSAGGRGGFPLPPILPIFPFPGAGGAATPPPSPVTPVLPTLGADTIATPTPQPAAN